VGIKISGLFFFCTLGTESLARFIFLLFLHIEEKKIKDEPCKEFSFGVWKKNKPFVWIILS